MDIPGPVAADLALLSDVLDSSSSDISVTLSDLVAEVIGSLPSFIGLSMLVGDPETQVEFTTIEAAAQTTRIRTSLRFPLVGDDGPGRLEGPSGVLIVYAATPGALVDLAADLAWLTGRPFSDARLDEDLGGPTAHEGYVSRLSTVNQATGVLMGRGLTAEEASAVLDTRAAATGVERHLVAAEILDHLSRPHEDPRAENS